MNRPSPPPRLVVPLLVVALGLPAVAGDGPPMARSLREGWGFADDIRDLGESLAGGYELSERDVDCDGAPEVLLERLALRGATGNRGYLLFDRGESGYRYLGDSGAVWAVVDYGAGGGCYLASYRRASAERLELTLAATGGGALEPLGSLDMLAGDAGTDEDNALLAALGSGRVEEQRLRELFSSAGLRAVELGPDSDLPWVERSSIEEVVETVEGAGRQVFERLVPAETGAGPASPWWGRVSPRVARRWAGAVEDTILGGELDDFADGRPLWLPPAGVGSVEILSSRVDGALRLSLPLGRPPVGVAHGRFQAAVRRWQGDAPRPIAITWVAALVTSRWGETGELLALFLGTAGEDDSRRVFRLERVTNLDYDREQEVVIEEETRGGRFLLVIDPSGGDGIEVRRLHAGSGS